MHFAIREAVQQNRASGLAIAPSPANLLVERLDGAGQRGVDHAADVGLVDAHTEGDGRHDDLQLSAEKGFLHAFTNRGFKAGVIRGSGKLAAELLGQFFGRFARGCVNNGRPPGGFPKKVPNELIAARLRHLYDFNREIVAAESVHEQLRFDQPQLRHDVLLHRRRGRRRKREDGRRAQHGKDAAQRAVVRTKIVTPSGDAVRLIDGDQGRLAASQHLWKARHAQPLRCDEQELQRSFQISPAGFPRRLARQAGMNAGHAQAARRQLASLIVHQGD